MLRLHVASACGICVFNVRRVIRIAISLRLFLILSIGLQLYQLHFYYVYGCIPLPQEVMMINYCCAAMNNIFMRRPIARFQTAFELASSADPIGTAVDYCRRVLLPQCLITSVLCFFFRCASILPRG